MMHGHASRLRALPFLCVLAGLASRTPAQDGGPPLSAPIVITYAPGGVQLTPALLNGLLQGCVGQRVEARRRQADPDWPRLRPTVVQDEGDARQPPGCFSATLVLGGRSAEHGDGSILEDVAAALQDELDRRLRREPCERSQAGVTELEAELKRAEDQLAEHREGLAAAQARTEDAEAALEQLRSETRELQLSLTTEEPLLAVEQKQSSELDAHMADLGKRLAALGSEAIELETRLEGGDDQGKVRRRLLDVQADRDHTSRTLDQLADRLTATSNSLQERGNRLLQVRTRLDAVAGQLDGAERRVKAARDVERRRRELEASVEALEARREDLRARLSDLTRDLAGAVPVRVQVWR